MINDLDLTAWQEGYGITGTFGARGQGDSDGDGDVDGRDFLIWQRQYTGPAPEEVVDTTPEPIVGASQLEPTDTASVEIIVAEEIASPLAVNQVNQASPKVSTLAVEAESVEQPLDLSDSFWLAPLPVINWEGRRGYLANASIAENFALRALLIDQAYDTASGKAEPYWRISSESGAEVYEDEELPPQENVWSTAADLAIEDWQIL